MMDTLAEESMANEKLGIMVEGVKIPGLLWCDDVVSLAEGAAQEEETLNEVDKFAKKNKIKWGLDKCNVLEIGKHNRKQQWKFGEKTIEKCDQYRYLGDWFTNDGTNKVMIEERRKKIKKSTRAIMTCGQSDIMKQIELKTILELHEKVNVPGLLTNAEAWNLTKTDEGQLERIELQILKQMLGVPITTPTQAIIYVTGTVYTTIRIDQKQLKYLQKVLREDENRWTRHILTSMDNYKIGWAKRIRQKLTEYELTEDWEEIKTKTPRQWKNLINTAME